LRVRVWDALAAAAAHLVFCSQQTIRIIKDSSPASRFGLKQATKIITQISTCHINLKLKVVLG